MKNQFESVNPISQKDNKNKEETNTNEILQLIISQAENIQIRPEDKDIEGHLLVHPNGPLSNLENELNWKMVRTPAFKEWFGDWQNNLENTSKIVDKNGEPLLVYHSSKKVFSEFNPEESSHLLTLGKGSYFTPDPSMSSIYGGLTYSCFLNVKNTINIPKTGMPIKNIIKTLYFSLTRPKDSALYSLCNNNEIINNEMYGNISQFSVLHKENIMMLPNDIENPLRKYRAKLQNNSL